MTGCSRPALGRLCAALLNEEFVGTALALVNDGDRAPKPTVRAEVIWRARYDGFDVTDDEVVEAYLKAWEKEPSVATLEGLVAMAGGYGGAAGEALTIRLLDDLRSQDGPFRWDAVRLRGVVELDRENGDPSAAAAFLRQALDAGNLRAKQGLGVALIKAGAPTEGEAVLKSAWFDDGDDMALFNLATFYRDEQRWQEALVYAESAMVHNYRWALEILRDCHAALGNQAVAQAADRNCQRL